jgi:hypothetical protein
MSWGGRQERGRRRLVQSQRFCDSMSMYYIQKAVVFDKVQLLSHALAYPCSGEVEDRLWAEERASKLRRLPQETAVATVARCHRPGAT